MTGGHVCHYKAHKRQLLGENLYSRNPTTTALSYSVIIGWCMLTGVTWSIHKYIYIYTYDYLSLEHAMAHCDKNVNCNPAYNFFWVHNSFHSSIYSRFTWKRYPSFQMGLTAFLLITLLLCLAQSGCIPHTCTSTIGLPW